MTKRCGGALVEWQLSCERKKNLFVCLVLLVQWGRTMVGGCGNEKAFVSEDNANGGIDGNFFVGGNNVDQISTLDMV